jgi:glutathione S-transferase
MKLYYHPLSSYSQKVLMAFHEKSVPFTPEITNVSDPAVRAEYEKLHPLCKVPLLVLSDGWRIPESSIIIEYLDTHFDSGTRLIPQDKDLARQTRFRDRMADLYVNDPMTAIFFDSRKPETEKEPRRVAQARGTLDKVYALIDRDLENKTWSGGDTFTMADCALLPALGYCQMIHPFDRWKNLTAYLRRGLERPSYQHVRAEAAPYLAEVR